MISTPFALRPKSRRPSAAPLPAPELRPSDTQALLAAHEEQSALDVLEGPPVWMTTMRRPSPGVREIAAYGLDGALIGVSTVYGWSDEP